MPTASGPQDIGKSAESQANTIKPSAHCKRRQNTVKAKSSHISTSSALQSNSGCKRKRAMDSEVESRRKQFYQQIDWRPINEQEQMFPTPVKDSPISENDPVTMSPLVKLSPGEYRSKRPGVLQEINAEAANSHYQFRNIFIRKTKTATSLTAPPPVLSCTDLEELFEDMVHKESIYPRSGDYLPRHQDLQPRMRSILLDWLMEVCEVYSLYRETFHISVDYIDRYLSVTSNIHKTRLQLVGVTALFLAAKFEEVYPPKLSDFAYVTDGACSEMEILAQELLMTNTLQWRLIPVTPVAWLSFYLQIAHSGYGVTTDSASSFYIRRYPQQTFVHIMQLLDLCTLDLESLDFKSSVLAASALYHFSCCEVATQVSRYAFKDLVACIQWMAPYAVTVRDAGLQQMKRFERVKESEFHNVQTHVNNIDTLDLAHENRSRTQSQLKCQSPTEIGGFMTPPKSGQKAPVNTTPVSGDVC